MSVLFPIYSLTLGAENKIIPGGNESFGQILSFNKKSDHD